LAAGFKVHWTSRFVEAAALLDRRVYDLVIADVMLPDGNELKIADAAKARGIRAIVITGFAFQVPTEQLARHEVLLKPPRPHELLSVIERRAV
jgi:DNA-binding response OmpR family regulator